MRVGLRGGQHPVLAAHAAGIGPIVLAAPAQRAVGHRRPHGLGQVHTHGCPLPLVSLGGGEDHVGGRGHPDRGPRVAAAERHHRAARPPPLCRHPPPQPGPIGYLGRRRGVGCLGSLRPRGVGRGRFWPGALRGRRRHQLLRGRAAGALLSPGAPAAIESALLGRSDRQRGRRQRGAGAAGAGGGVGGLHCAHRRAPPPHGHGQRPALGA
mmetsp:Transcript_38481/g.120153  ORF Transcript_38481/g.120153 Transcript_38481/m.120153 type:complete len:210 (-) Transcript_38481:299-928(-)